MAINMQGSWTVSVKSKSAAFNQRFIIEGATTGNGTYAGEVATPAVFVTGNAWSIRIQSNPGKAWVDSVDQITFPTVAGGQYRFDIQSNDPGGDLDFNDLILTCSAPQTLTDFLIYGNVSYYGPGCIFNPCFLPYLVIETPAALTAALANPHLRVPIEKLYPDRLKVPPIPPPGPLPDPVPFRPLIIPLREQVALPTRVAQVFGVSNQLGTTPASGPQGKVAPAEQSGGAEAASAVVSTRTVSLQAAAPAATVEFNRAAVAGIIDHMLRICDTGSLPGVVLSFQQYDRTNAELAGGSYTGTGSREGLGVCATDRNGNYIFRFSRDLAQFIHEAFFDVAAGENVLTQILPDVIVRLLDPMKPGGFCYESAPYWNIPYLRQINICVPAGCAPRPRTSCQGLRAIQAIGDILIVDPNNKLGAEGRITAKSSLPNTPQARCAAWLGALDFFACFLDQPQAIYYTIRFRKLGDTGWNFFQEKYTHLKIANLGIPGYTGDLVGPNPAIPPLHVDGGAAVPAPAYLNIENDPAWVFTHRDRKAVISSWLYAPIPGPVQFRVEGYDAAGAKVVAADDTITLYIDNNGPVFDIASVDMLGEAGGACALFTLPADDLNAPLTVRFRANQLEGFLNAYALSVTKGNLGNFAVDMVVGPGLGQISGAYVHGDDVVCNVFEGTFDDPTHDGSGYVTAEIVPHAPNNWLDADQPFCTFAINLGCSIRATNGYNIAVYGYGPTQYFLGIQKAP